MMKLVKRKYSRLSKRQKDAVCRRHSVDSCFSICPFRVTVGRSIICLRDIERVSKIDMMVQLTEEEDAGLGIEIQTAEISGPCGSGSEQGGSCAQPDKNCIESKNNK